MDHDIQLLSQHLMGIKIPRLMVQTQQLKVQFGVVGTSTHTDTAMSRFVEVLALLGELAELENTVLRLAMELRKTQRRCNALSKIFMPTYRETIGYIMGTLEERERESIVILKMIRDRLSREGPRTGG
jgi:V/A-type H+-transporting ATPase subunit D